MEGVGKLGQRFMKGSEMKAANGSHGRSELRGLRVLIVEDVGIVAIEEKLMLEQLGCTVIGPEPTLDRGLAAAREQELDGALLDINLAGRSSFPIAAALRQRGVPFIFVSGYGSGQLEGRFRGSPMMEKPFSRSAVAGLMGRILRTERTAEG